MLTITAISTSSSIFHRPASPSERRCVSLMKSSRNPIAPHASVVNSTVSPCSVKCVDARNATVAASRIISPPIVGVPDFAQ